MIDEAIKIAKRSTHAKHQTGCVIVDVSSKTPIIVSNGWSHKGNWDYGTGLYSVHAEIHALVRCKHLELNSNYVAYVATIARKSGNVVNSESCLTCATALVAAGITQVVFTVNQVHDSTAISTMFLPNAIESAGLKVYRQKTDECC